MKIGSLFYRLMPYLLAIVFCLVLGGIASLLQKEALSEWYPFLVKSSLTPPGYVFPIVWGDTIRIDWNCFRSSLACR